LVLKEGPSENERERNMSVCNVLEQVQKGRVLAAAERERERGLRRAFKRVPVGERETGAALNDRKTDGVE
jgi:hypothetical protein